MSEQLKSHLTNEYLMFILEYADPSQLDKANIEEQIKGPIAELFKYQRSADRARRMLKDGFGKAVALYLSQFNAPVFDAARLSDELSRYKKTFVRHLGKERVAHLSFILKLAKLVETEKQAAPVKRGLLKGA